jgi:hypothetical protein
MSTLHRLLLAGMILLTICRWMMAAAQEITPAEAAVWNWSVRWSPVGYEGGGVAPLLAKASCGVLGKSAFAVRFFAPIAAAVLAWLLFRLVSSMAGERAAAWAVTLLQLTPAANVGAVQLQPRWIAATFGAAGMLLTWRALHRAGAWQWRWPAAGAAFGFATLTDWSAAWMPLAVLAMLLIFRRWRGRLRGPGVWMLAACWILSGIGPIAAWNASHAGAGWLRLAERAGMLTDDGPAHALRTLGWLLRDAAAGFSPVLLAVAVLAAAGVIRSSRRSDAQLFLGCFAILPAVAMLAMAVLGAGSADFLTCSLPAAAGLTALWWQSGEYRPAWQRALPWPALSVAAACSLLALDSDLLRRSGLAVSYNSDPTAPRRGWTAAASEINDMLGDLAAEGEAAMLIAQDGDVASVLEFLLPEDARIFRPDSSWPRVQVVESPVPRSQQAFWPRYDMQQAGENGPCWGRNAIFLAVDPGDAAQSAPDALSRAFSSVEPLAVFAIYRHRLLLRRIHVLGCRDYSGLPL